MRRTTSAVVPRALLGWIVLLGISGCVAQAPRAASGALTVAVAPLTLGGVTNATYVLTVTNGQGAVVWSRSVEADRYGDGAGAVSYVGTCDPGANPNTVALAVAALEADGSALVAGTDWFNPAPEEDPVVREAICVEGAAVAVSFDLALARPAQQGFFDVAVSFQDVFCSAKLDCQRDVGGELVDLELLFNPLTGVRDLTAVLGFACTAGPDQDTVLHMGPVAVQCTSAGLGASVDVAAGPGNLDPPFAGPAPNTTALLFQAAVYRGEELLGDNHKAYWNVALGLNRAALAVAGSCRLTASATVSDGAFVGGVSPSGTRWPYVAWDVALSAAGAVVCGQHEVGGGDGVAVLYGASEGVAFAGSWSWATGAVERHNVVDECAVEGGGCGANSTCTDTIDGFVCGCVAGRADCNGSVVDGCEVALATDPAHCGSCEWACADGLLCAGGECYDPCAAGLADCNGSAVDGCEVVLATDHANCGSCGRVCADDLACGGGDCYDPCAAGPTTLTYTGAAQSLTVPAGCNVAAAKLWGGGGGGSGGSGGFAAGDVAVTLGATLVAIVAGGGGAANVSNGAGGVGGFGGGGRGGAGAGSFYQGGGGGGYSGLFAGAVSQANALLVAGGGGGSGNAGSTVGGVGGGASGGAAANNGVCYPVVGAGGGTQAAGGLPTGIVAGNGHWYSGGAGGALTGGAGGPPYTQWGGGAGGGGYFGGGGGNGDDGWNFCNYGGSGSAGSSGGGGSGHAKAGVVTNAVLTPGLAGGAAPNASDPDYVAGVATAGTTNAGVGGHGRVVIIWGYRYPGP